jgi:hypothetical protein
MKELEKEFIGTGEVRGWKFKQIACSPYALVSEVTTFEGSRHYETFERKESKNSDYVIVGKCIHKEAKIKYPKSKDFGVWAWCIRDYGKALSKWEELNKEKTNSSKN